MTEPLALSTMYFQHWLDPDDLEPFFAAGQAMGFACFELNHMLRRAAVERIDRRGIDVRSVHHPCPAVRGPGAEAQLASADRKERGLAVREVATTLETAVRVGARAVVLHLGSARQEPDRELPRRWFEVQSRYSAGQCGQPPYATALVALRALVADREAERIDGAIDALAEVLRAARHRGVRLGVETGYYPYDLPTPSGMSTILGRLADPLLGAWLDTGHVGARQHLGLSGFDAWHAAVNGRWIGAHFHDVVGLRDHLVPGMGDVPFEAIGRRLDADAQRTMEVDWYFRPNEVRAGLDHLLGCGCARA